MAEFLKWLWCSMAHLDGTYKRDPGGRANYQCAKCGRWLVRMNGRRQ